MILPIFASTCKKATCKEFCNRKISTISVFDAAKHKSLVECF